MTNDNKWQRVEYISSTKLYQAGKELNNEKLHQVGADFARRTNFAIWMTQIARFY